MPTLSWILAVLGALVLLAYAGLIVFLLRVMRRPQERLAGTGSERRRPGPRCR